MCSNLDGDNGFTEFVKPWAVVTATDSDGTTVRFGVIGYVDANMCSFTSCTDIDFTVTVDSDIEGRLNAAKAALDASGEAYDFLMMVSGFTSTVSVKNYARRIPGIQLVVATGGGMHFENQLNTPAEFQADMTLREYFDDADEDYPSVVTNSGTNSDAYIVAVEGHTHYYGVLDMTLDVAAKSITAASGNAVAMWGCGQDSGPHNATTTPCVDKSSDAFIADLIADFNADVDAYKSSVVGQGARRLDGAKSSCRMRECEVGVLMAEAIR